MVSFSRDGAGGGVSVVLVGSCDISVGSGLLLPETESLNSRIPVPSDRPISGRRFAPKSSRATIRSRMISGALIFGIEPAYQRFCVFPVHAENGSPEVRQRGSGYHEGTSEARIRLAFQN